MEKEDADECNLERKMSLLPVDGSARFQVQRKKSRSSLASRDPA